MTIADFFADQIFHLCVCAHTQFAVRSNLRELIAFKRSTSAAESYAGSKEPIVQQTPLRILCTEDDVDTRELITFVLRQNNFEVITTETPTLAIEVARTFSFDLYLVDNWMPVMSGPALCKELRSFDSETPILFYSAAGYEADKTAAYASGAQGYLVKPVDNDELVAEVRRLISESRARRSTQVTHAAANEGTQLLAQHASAS